MFSLLAASVSQSNVPAVSYSWKNAEIVGGGFVTGIVFHPHQKDLVYARTDIGGAYRLDTKAKRWIPLQDWLGREDWNLYGTESIALDPTDPKKLYLAVGTYTNDWAGNGAILRSSDQGKTFLRSDLPFKNGGNMDGRSIGERLAVDPNKGSILYFGSRNNGLWRSEDSGATWKQDTHFPAPSPSNGVGVGFVVFDPYAGAHSRPTDTIYAGVARGSDNLYQTHNAGTTWELVPGQPSGFTPHHMVISPDGTIYLTYANGPGPNNVTDGAVWKYRPSTGEWKDISPQKPNAADKFGYAGLSVDASNPKTLIVSSLDKWTTGDDVWRSTDAGTTWKSLKAHAVRDSSASPFLNWDHPSADLGHWIGDVEIDPYRPGRAMYVTGATIWGTEDLTKLDEEKDTHWTVEAAGIEETAVIDLLSPTSGAHLVSALGDIGGFRHDDFSISPKSGIRTNPVMSNTDSIDYAALKPTLYVRVGRGAGTGGYSEDEGTSWHPFLKKPSDQATGGTVAISADGASVVWAPTRSAPFVTRDWGATWIACGGLTVPAEVLSDRAQSGTFYAYAEGKLFRSVDGGMTFEVRSSGLPDANGRLRVSDGAVWLPTKQGLYRISEGGSQATRLNSVQSADQVGFGKAAPGGKSPVIFLIGVIRGVSDAFRSDDDGATWRRITDAQHRFGTMNNICGDPRIYGRVYLGTNGRGVLVGDPK